MHLSFARCFFFYLSFLFPPVEPGVFNCCETIKQDISDKEISCFYLIVSEQPIYIYLPSLPFSCQFLQSCLPTDEGMVQIDKIEFILLKHLNIYAYSSILLVK